MPGSAAPTPQGASKRGGGPGQRDQSAGVGVGPGPGAMPTTPSRPPLFRFSVSRSKNSDQLLRNAPGSACPPPGGPPVRTGGSA